MANPQMPNIPGAAVMTDTLDFVKNLWGSMGVPGMAIPGITAPTLSIEELDKKINDLKAVEAWLNLNMTMLRGTIQAYRIQFGQLDPWRFGALGGIQLQRDFIGAFDGALKQALVHVADLFNVQCTVRQCATLELLDGFQQQQDGAVVDGQGLGWITAPV